MSQTLNFTTLLSNAPMVSRSGGGGRSADPNHARYWRGKKTQTLTLPVRFLTECHYRTGMVLSQDGEFIVLMSTQTYEENGGRPWMKLHQDPDTRHLVIPKNSAVGDLLDKTSHSFIVEETEADDLPTHTKAYKLVEVK